ncbi:MAG TPA: nucleotidyltransferase [Verrucomicrobiae bacterium]|nr:nucleotidyltransferase [Verrucomicrobiae bacterium]
MGIIEILNHGSTESGFDFLIIGGYAVNAHGYARLTVDLDILINKAHRDFWKELMLKNGYTVYNEHENFSQFTPVARDQLPVDFMFVNEQTFQKMRAEAVAGVMGGIKVKHPSLMHLIALKLHVIKQALPHRASKDLYDVIQLVQINHVDVKSGDFKQLCEKFGDKKTYEAIVRATR